jgi:hypothetical protein
LSLFCFTSSLSIILLEELRIRRCEAELADPVDQLAVSYTPPTWYLRYLRYIHTYIYIQVHTYKLLVTVSCSDPLSLSSLFNSSFLSSLFLLPHPLGERVNSSAFLSSFSSSFFFLFYFPSHLSFPIPLPPPPRQFPFSESFETGPTGKSRDSGRLNSRPLFLCPTEPVLESSISLRPRPSTFVSSNAGPPPP